MQVIRTIIWMALAVIVSLFVWMNWTKADLRIWPLDKGYLVLPWPIGFIALVSFVFGFIPPWLLGRGAKWRLNRRIASLENSLRAATVSTPVATTTQLEAAAPPATPPAPAEEPGI